MTYSSQNTSCKSCLSCQIMKFTKQTQSFSMARNAKQTQISSFSFEIHGFPKKQTQIKPISWVLAFLASCAVILPNKANLNDFLILYGQEMYCRWADGFYNTLSELT
jgi:hypothetical protein